MICGETIADFDRVRRDLLSEDPALVAQLEDTSFKVFRNLKLPDNNPINHAVRGPTTKVKLHRHHDAAQRKWLAAH